MASVLHTSPYRFALNSNKAPNLLWQDILEQAAPMGLASDLA